MSKDALREQVLSSRRERGAEQRLAVADAIAAHLLASTFARVPRLACYLSMGTEPGTGPLITGLLQRGADVIVPVASEGGPSAPPGVAPRLDWVVFDPAAPLRPSPIGIPEPDGPRLGTDAIQGVGLVIVPALAVDHKGHRLGRGAGYYDRALTSVRAPVCAVVHTDELLESIPHEPHDVPVQMAVTESGVFRVPGQPGRDARSGLIQ